MDLSQFSSLPIKHLDLTKCANFTLTKPLSLPSIETITIHSNERTPKASKALRKWVHNAEGFKIVVIPNEAQNSN